MRLRKTICYGILTIALFTGCASNRQLMYPSHQPVSETSSRFIDGIVVSGKPSEINTDIVTNSSTEEFSKKYIETFPGGKYLQSKYSDMLKVQPGAIRSLKLYTFIDEWYGVRYCMGGNSKSGIDCSSFVQQLYDSVFRINIVRTSFDQFNSVTYVSQKAELREGDLVFFRTHGRHISHVGVYLMNSYFVHASTGGVTISSLNEDYWSRRFAGAGYIDKSKG